MNMDYFKEIDITRAELIELMVKLSYGGIIHNRHRNEIAEAMADKVAKDIYETAIDGPKRWNYNDLRTAFAHVLMDEFGIKKW